MSDKCESCGVAWVDHLGMIGTCAKLKAAEARIAELEAIVAKLRISADGVRLIPGEDEAWIISGDRIVCCYLTTTIDSEAEYHQVLYDGRTPYYSTESAAIAARDAKREGER